MSNYFTYVFNNEFSFQLIKIKTHDLSYLLINATTNH